MSSTGKRDQDDYDGKDNDNNHDGDHADDGTGNEAHPKPLIIESSQKC